MAFIDNDIICATLEVNPDDTITSQVYEKNLIQHSLTYHDQRNTLYNMKEVEA